MKILLTGANGFLGAYFFKKYQKKNDITKFSFRSDDFNKLLFNNIDTIIHLSALVHQMGGATKEEYDKININQTIELAKKAKVNGVKHFVFMSTIKVYGEETNSPYTENSKCKSEVDYGKSKLNAEIELQKLEDNNFKVSIIRTPIVYGYGVKANIKNLIQLVKKTPLLPFGYIKNKRSMVYIGNLCHLIDIVIQKQERGVFLAGDDDPISTTKLIKLISKALNKNTVLIKIPLFATLLKIVKPNIYQRLYGDLEVNNDLTKKRLDFKNPYTVEDGIKYMIHGE